MTGQVQALFRHPIKAHGRERLESAAFETGKTLRHDREWAVLHEDGSWDGENWTGCRNFSRGARVGTLMAIEARRNAVDGSLVLTHPRLPELRFHPETQAERFLRWVQPLMEGQGKKSVALVRVPDRGMTDTNFPSISINNLASLRALSEQMGQHLEPERFRGNIWIDGLERWVEHTWPERILQIGGARLRGVEVIQRCVATTVNPATGERDAETLIALRKGWGHIDFGLYAEVIEGGAVHLGDRVEVIG